jgi:hypothetical protein
MKEPAMISDRGGLLFAVGGTARVMMRELVSLRSCCSPTSLARLRNAA